MMQLPSTSGTYLLIGPGGPALTINHFLTKNGHTPCNACPMCKKALAGIHPDLVRSVDDSIEEAHILIRSVRRKTSEVKLRTISLEGMRSTSFQNALLKLLEDPGQATQIIWSLPSTDGLLDTVLSRSKLIHLEQRTIVRSKDAQAEAQAFMQAIKDRNLLGLLSIEWNEPEQTLSEILRLSLQLKNMWNVVDRVTEIQHLHHLGRPYQNLIQALVEEIMKSL